MAAPRKHPPKNSAETIRKLATDGHSTIGIAKQLGVGREAFMRWLDEHEDLQEAFDVGRETERHYLHSLIVQAAVLNKGANSNAMFLLKARHGYREGDQQNVQVAVEMKSVMVVTSHGTDEQWALKSAQQQQRLMIEAQQPLNITPAQQTPVIEPVATLALTPPELPPWMVGLKIVAVQASPAPIVAESAAAHLMTPCSTPWVAGK